MTPSTSAGLIGSVLGDRYELTRHIARGGMSDVYEGQDRLLRRPVAVKVYRSSAPADRSRFDAEVVTLAALNHPGLVQVYDAGEWGDDGYVVLELVDGPTLRSILDERGALSPASVASLGAAMAAALAYVHAAGVVHRDVTPSNVLCADDGRPRLADFGIARLLDTTRITITNMAVGTAAYMAPEQVEGHDVTPAADVYALGLVLLEALTGRCPFAGTSHEVAVARLARDPEIDNTAVPASWRGLLRDMTCRDPAARPAAAVVAEQLEALSAAASNTPAVVVGAVSVDSHAPTEAVPIVAGTTVMPAVLRPEPPSDDPADTKVGLAAMIGSPQALWLVLGAILVVVMLFATQGGGGLDIPTPTTQSVSLTSQPPAATTAPPTTAAPAPVPAPEPAGKGKGHDKKGD